MIRRFLVAGISAAVLAVAFAGTASAKTFVVTQGSDPAPGACNANCSLREAVLAANERSGADVVRLASHTHRVTRDTPFEDLGETGDLDVHDDLTIVGRGSRSVIDGEWEPIADALILAHANVDLALRKVTVRDGNSTEDYSAVNFLGPGDLRLTNVRILSNRADYSAVATQGMATFRRVVFSRNVATGCCAALYNLGAGEIRLVDVVFDRNRATDDTGAMYSAGTSAVFNRVTFSRNHAGTVGGALIASSGTNTLRNVTFSQNSADAEGGALYLHENATLNNVTMFKNVADRDDNDDPGAGGAIYNAGGVATVSNSIIAGNREGGDGLNSCGADGVESAGFNLFGPGFGCVILAAPGDVDAGQVGLKSKLRRNGGFAPSHGIKRSSAARNNGQNSSCESRDQRGVKRPQGPRCDMGAYELKRG